MQSSSELFKLIAAGRPDIDAATIQLWCKYLGQLKNCHLFSVASPEKDQKEWLRERKAGIGGSEIASVLGANHWSSPRQIWMSKMGMFDDNPKPQSEQARWGNLLETTVATEWGIREGRKWVHIPVILQSDDRSYLLANIDGFTLSDDAEEVTGILEIKTTSAYNNDIWEYGPIPDNYVHQVNWYCGITNLTQYTIVCLVGGQKLYHYELPADPERFSQQVAAADDFWNEHVLTGVEPEANENDKTELMEARGEDVEDVQPIVFTDDEAENLAEAYCQLREKVSSMKKLQTAIQAQLLVKLAAAPAGITKTHTIEFTTTHRRSCNFDMLQSSFPEAFNACVTESETRSIKIK